MKSACARLSSRCGITVQTSRKTVQVVCKELYVRDVYLSSKEQEKQEPQTENNRTENMLSTFKNNQ